MNLRAKSLLILCLLSLSACGGYAKVREWVVGKPKPPYSVLQPHETWCYGSLAEPVCYSEPQDVLPDNLISVDPPSRYPMTNEDYWKAVASSRKAKEQREAQQKDQQAK